MKENKSAFNAGLLQLDAGSSERYWKDTDRYWSTSICIHRYTLSHICLITTTSTTTATAKAINNNNKNNSQLFDASPFWLCLKLANNNIQKSLNKKQITAGKNNSECCRRVCSAMRYCAPKTEII